jgi:hypothetical protein
VPELSHHDLVKLAEKAGITLLEGMQLRAYRGAKGKAVVAMVHGYGASEKAWIDPYREKDFGGCVTYDLVLAYTTKPPTKRFLPGKLDMPVSFSTPLRLTKSPPKPMWTVLKEDKLNLITWTQRMPLATYRYALEELEIMVKLGQAIFGSVPIVLLSHSRGGVVVRRFVQNQYKKWPDLKKVILLASPNHGTDVARLNKDEIAKAFDAELQAAFEKLEDENKVALGPDDKAGITAGLKDCFSELGQWLGGDGLRELAPGSPLIKELEANEKLEVESKIAYLNLAGESNVFTKLYLVVGKKYFELLNFLRSLPDGVLPEELQDGKGDGLTALIRAQLSWAAVQPFAVNHGTILIDRQVQKTVADHCSAL